MQRLTTTRWKRTRLAVAVAGLFGLLVLVSPSGLGAQPRSAGEAPAASSNVWLTERRVLNMAHGGGLREAPQGTLYAYKTAAERGANALEMDLHITLDGHVVAIHDSTVDRTTNGNGCVVAHTLAELKALDAAHTFVPGQGPVGGLPADAYPLRGVATGEIPPPPGFTPDDFTIATLEEIFQAAPDAYMIMELKPTEVYQTHDCPAFVESLPPEDRPDLVAEVARLIDQYDMTDKVMVASFIDDLMHRFQELAPEVDTSFPLLESLAVYQAFLAGDPLPNPNGHEAFQVPRAYGPIVITREIADYARANDVAVHFWTINDPDEMVELLDWGVDGLITDVPQTMSGLLDDRGDPQPMVASATGLAADPSGQSEVDQPVSFAVDVTAGWPYPVVDGPVDLLVDGQVVAQGTVVDGQAALVVDDLPVGVHEISAAFGGSARVLASMSASLTHQVTAPPTTTTTTATPSTTTPSTSPATSAGATPGPGPADATLTAASPETNRARPLPVTGGGLALLGPAVVLLAVGLVLYAVARRRTSTSG